MKYDICSIGHITRDKVVTPEKTVYMSGGTSYYMTYAISRLPKAVSYQLVTKVGESESAGSGEDQADGGGYHLLSQP